MKKGFTLIELLVVVLIIGILSAVALPQYKKAVMKAKLTQVYTILNAYGKAIDMWFMASGERTAGKRVNFTGIHKDFELDIDLPGVTPVATEKSADQYKDMYISAYIAESALTSSVQVAWIDGVFKGCGVNFMQARNHGDLEWRFVSVGKLNGTDMTNHPSTFPEECKDLGKIMCAEWGPTGMVSQYGATQCKVTRKPYSDGF